MEEEMERNKVFQDRLENGTGEEEEDEMFNSTEMNEVTHPQFQDPIIQRTLAHRKLQRYQADDDKISYIIERVIEKQNRNKRTFLKRPQTSRKGTLEFYLVDNVLYAYQEGEGKGKPVLPQGMIVTEVYREQCYQYDGIENGKNPEKIIQKYRKTLAIRRTPINGCIPKMDGQSSPQHSR